MIDDEIDMNANDNVKWIPNIEESQALYEEFQIKFPIEKLKTLSLDEYINTDKKSSFCYWVETRLRKLGSIKGATSYKFGIYEYIQDPRDDNGYLFDEKYAWLSKYGNNRTEVYNKILSNIVKIAECAKNGDFDGIEKIDISNMFKWKIAFLYSEYKFLNFYAEDGLRYLAKKYGIENSENVTFAEMYKFLLSKKQNNENIFVYASNLWNEWLVYKNEENKKRKYWSGGIYWGEEKKLEEFSKNNYWQIGWEKESDKKGSKQAWNNIKEIQNGDFVAFHGYGGQNDLTIYQISKVINKDIDKGILFIEKLNMDEDILFHGKAPKLNKGGWFGTLFQLTGEEAINKIFGNYIQGDTQMTQENSLVKKYANLLKNTKNVILTGAPGTGKTFMAKTVAARIILEREINDFDKDLTEEEKKQVESQTDFVQFHPSYDYTDFVEGLRPKQVDGSEQIGFERKDGVFKAFCEKALKESYRENNDNVDNFEECWKKLVDELNENDFVTIPLISGKGDFRVELNEYGTGLANRTYENDDYQKGKWIQGKSKFFSKDQLYNIYQGLPGTPAGGHDNYRKAVVEYMKKNLGLLDYKKTESTQKTKKNFVFIIDEINRGEVAKIFGELFYCIDPGYRGEKGRISTQYQNLVTSGEFQKGFFIPENVYIIGTMNDIDRSVESMDFAFRRRFTWAEVKASDTVDMLDPKYDDNGELIAGLEKNLAEEAKRRMENLNAAISKIHELNEAYHIGASYFLKLNNYDGDFGKLWDYHIKGILTEYLRGNPNAQEELEKLKAAYDKAEEK